MSCNVSLQKIQYPEPSLPCRQLNCPPYKHSLVTIRYKPEISTGKEMYAHEMSSRLGSILRTVESIAIFVYMRYNLDIICRMFCEKYSSKIFEVSSHS